MAPNIFSISFHYYRLGDEDMITALWHYVLAAVPGVGQAFVDHIVARTALPAARFVSASDHGVGDNANRPDLLLRCDNWNLLFEHKVDSPLGPLQLERYLAWARLENYKLAVMAKRHLDISPAVLAAPEFVAPSDVQEPRHFLWNDLQPILRASDQPLGIEFAEFLEERGLSTFTWGGRGSPFFNGEAANELRHVYDSVRPVFTDPAVRFMKKNTSLIYEVRRPMTGVHLINIGPLESVSHHVDSLRGPVMALWVWVPGDAALDRKPVLPAASGPLADSGLPIIVSSREPAQQWSLDRQIFCERFYYVPLGEVLLDSPESCNAAMRSFAHACVDHLKADLARL